MFLIFCSFTCSAAAAQESSPIPAAPQPPQGTTTAQGNALGQTNTGGLSGTVLDANGAVLQGASVSLASQAGSAVKTLKSGNDGQFAFPGLPAGAYKLSISAPGMSTFTSPQIDLRAGEFQIVPAVKLSLAPVSTSLTINGNKEEVSKQQVQIAVHQRVVGVIPNFYSTFDWNAPPMLPKQKVQLSVRSIIDPVSILTVAGIAGAEQYQNVFPAFGGGIEGYGKRFGAQMANHASATLLGRGVYPSIFHQDPRYFYMGSRGSTKKRILYALAAAVIAKGDNGNWEPNYSDVLGSFSSAALSNLYYPQSERGASLVLLNGFAGIGSNAASNLIREFVLKRFTSHVPKGANGKP